MAFHVVSKFEFGRVVVSQFEKSDKPAGPLLSVLILWVAGISHILIVTLNVLIFRDIFHPQLLDKVLKMRWAGDESLCLRLNFGFEFEF